MTKPITSKDLPRRDLDPAARVEPPTASLQTRDLSRPDPGGAAYCIRHAMPAEWVDFEERVRKRMSSKPALVTMRCDRCGLVTSRDYWKGKDGGACIRCNFQGYADGGHMKDMTAAELRAYEKAEAERKAVQAERDRTRRLYLCNTERGKSGLDPLTMEQMLAKEKSDWERARAAGRLV